MQDLLHITLASDLAYRLAWYHLFDVRHKAVLVSPEEQNQRGCG